MHDVDVTPHDLMEEEDSDFVSVKITTKINTVWSEIIYKIMILKDDDIVCRICEEKRAIYKCKECDDDLFCKSCFRELHQELGEMHKPKMLTKWSS